MSETEELIRGKPRLYWRLNAAMTVAFVVGAIGLATTSVGLIWEAETVARLGGSIAATCAVTFFACLFFAWVISESYENRNTTGETTETQ
jgi:uncharacterized membrane protein YqjE